MMNFIPIKSSSTASLYILESEDRRLLIEAGLSGKALKKAVGFKLSSFDGCLASHGHGDHFKGIQDVIKAGVNVFASKETKEACKEWTPGHRMITVEPMKKIIVANRWHVTPFEAIHDCPGALGFHIDDGNEKLVFLTDSQYCKYRFKEVDYYAMECNFSYRTWAKDVPEEQRVRIARYHMSMEAVCEYFRKADLSKTKRIYLLHLSAGNSDAALFKNEVEAMSGVPVKVCRK